MMVGLVVERSGPMVTVQDIGHVGIAGVAIDAEDLHARPLALVPGDVGRQVPGAGKVVRLQRPREDLGRR